MKKLFIFWTVALLGVSLFQLALPASVSATTWSEETIPSTTGEVIVSGSDVSDLAVASDNTTIYAVDRQSDKIYRSTNAGVSWTELTKPAGATEPQLVAVAPDDADFVAIVADDNEVYVSDDGGASWDSMGTVAATIAIKDLDSSVESGSNHFVAVVGDNGTDAKVYYYEIGAIGAQWELISDEVGFAGDQDEAGAVAFSPNFASDEIMVAVTANLSDAINFQVFSFNFEEWNDIGGFSGYPVAIASDDGITGLDSASISLSPDYLGSDSDLRVAFVGLTVAGDTDAVATSGIYRLDDDDLAALETDVQIHSVDFNGTNLVAGRYDNNIVYRSADPLATTPTVSTTSSRKRPSGDDKVIVGWAGSNVVAGTTGNESSFAISRNNGQSFNDISLIDTALTTLEDVWVTPDGSKVYLISNDSADLSLWRYASSWERVLNLQGDTGYIVRGSPDNNDVLYLAKTGATALYYTSNAGETGWEARSSLYNIQDLAVESAAVAYIAVDVDKTVSKSIDSGFTWSSANSTALPGGNIHMITSIGVDKLIVGGTTGYVSYSTDGNSSWANIGQSIEAGATNVQVTASGLTSGDYIYAASSKADTKVMRWQIGTSANWMDMSAPTTAGYGAYGIALREGVLYVANSDSAANSEVLRTLNPTAGTVDWSTLASAGETFTCSPSALRVSAGSNKLWAINTDNAELYSYTDTLPDISVSPTSINFGSVTVGSSSSPQTVTITNDGSANLTIGTITIGGADAAEFSTQNDNASGQIVAPSANATLEVVFSPTSEGSKSATLSIPSDDPDEGTVTVTLTGMATEAVGAAGGLSEPPSGTDYVYDVVTTDGKFTEDVTAESEDGKVELDIDEGTVGLTEKGKKLFKITINEEKDPPTPHEDTSIVGSTYDLGPDGATFDPPITLNMVYETNEMPKGVNPKNLVISTWVEKSAGEWVTLKGCAVNLETNTVTAPVSHFSIFSVLASIRPADFITSDLTISPTVVDMGESVIISVLVTNTGDLAGSYEVTLVIDNVAVATKEVTLDGGASQTVTFTKKRDVSGTCTVNVNGLSDTFTVKTPATPTPTPLTPPVAPAPVPTPTPPVAPSPPIWWLIGGIIAVVVVAITYLLIRRWRRA